MNENKESTIKVESLIKDDSCIKGLTYRPLGKKINRVYQANSTQVKYNFAFLEFEDLSYVLISLHESFVVDGDEAYIKYKLG